MKKIILDRRCLVVLLLVFVFVLLTVLMICASVSGAVYLKNDSDRRGYIKALGITDLKNEYSVKSITVPTDFSVVYTNYNKLQRKAGFDLLKYRGAKAKLYTYEIKDNSNSVKHVNLIIYRNRIIGGDVSSTELSGEMLPLNEKEIKKCLK